jgi:tellurite resistance protein TerC
MLSGGDDFNPKEHWVTKALYRTFRVTDELHGSQFLAKIKGPDGTVDTWLTPLAAALVVVNVVDVIFAIDSIPAVFGLTNEWFIVFTSNIFAVLGLRSMYFALSALLGKFHYLKYALAIILGMIGVKMLCEKLIEKHLHFVHEHMISITLGFIVTALATGIIASLLYAKRHPGEMDALDVGAKAEQEANA